MPHRRSAPRLELRSERKHTLSPVHWKAHVKRAIPPRFLNETLLRLPFLYGTRLVRYETNLIGDHGVDDLLEQLDGALEVPGDVVECGSSRCGGTVLMARRLAERGSSKRIWACDSFEGFDLQELERERQAGLTRAARSSFTSTSFDYVRRKLRVLGVADRVELVRGYFKDTLPGLSGPFAFAFIDCDLQESIRFAADSLWPLLSPGGRLVFDDYACDDFRGARLAVDDFIAARRPQIVDHGLLRRLYFVRKR